MQQKLKGRFLFLISVCIIHFTAVNAQNSGKISGKTIDKNNTPVEFTNILLFNMADTSTLVQGTITDSLGNFSLDRIYPARYLLKIQSIGFTSIRQIFLMEQDEDKNAGIFILEPDAKLLQTVVITGRKDFIKKTPQGIIINASSTLTQEGGTAVDLLKNAPTIVVDAEGGITLRGKTPMFLINGRNSNLTNLANIPATSIESIEIINNPGAQYDADAESGIVNIKLKKNKQEGSNGAIGIGTGYGAKPRFNSSVLLSHKTGKINTSISYDNRLAGRIRKADGDRINFNIIDRHFLTQRRNDDRTEQTHNLRFNLDYEVNANNVLTFEVLGSLGTDVNKELLFSTFETDLRAFTSKNSRYSYERARDKVGEFSINYLKKYAAKKKKLTANISSSFKQDNENTDITTQSLTSENLNIEQPYLQRTLDYQKSNITNIRADFAQPVGRGLFETGYKTILRFLNADYKSQNKINDVYENNPLISNILDFNEQIHAIYAQYSSSYGDIEKPALVYDFGLRAEAVQNHGQSISNNAIDFKNNYFNLFPTANLTYYLKEESYFKFSYGRRINRPGLGQLNPFTDITDSLSQRSGNPNLKPELIQSFELGYNRDFSTSSFSSKIYYRYANNSIQNYTILRPDGVLFAQPVNVGHAVTYGWENIVSINPGSFWNSNVSFSVFQQEINAGNINVETVNKVFSWSTKMINNFSVFKGGKVQLIGVYNAPTATAQGTRIAVYNIDFGLQQKVIGDRARLGIVITDIFNTQKSGFVFNTSEFDFTRKFKVDTRAILITFGYTFGSSFKEKLLENQFSND